MVELAVRTSLPPWADVLVVVAHPDDESFGLGAVISAFTGSGSVVRVLCLTRGEASTLGAVHGLADVRAAELLGAAHALGVTAAELRAHPDGRLAEVRPGDLESEVRAAIELDRPDGILVFDPTSGVTGHPDHEVASRAALRVAAQLRVPALGWALPASVAATLNAEYAAGFAGFPQDEIDVVIDVDRTKQRAAVTCHETQAVPGSVLWRRLELLGDREHLRWLVDGR